MREGADKNRDLEGRGGGGGRGGEKKNGRRAVQGWKRKKG